MIKPPDKNETTKLAPHLGSSMANDVSEKIKRVGTTDSVAFKMKLLDHKSDRKKNW